MKNGIMSPGEIKRSLTLPAIVNAVALPLLAAIGEFWWVNKIAFSAFVAGLILPVIAIGMLEMRGITLEPATQIVRGSQIFLLIGFVFGLIHVLSA